MAWESRTALRYLTGLRALPWAISTILLRLLRSPRLTLEALLRKAGVNLRSGKKLARSQEFPAAISRNPAHHSVNPQPNSVLHLVTNSLPYTQAGYTIRTHNIIAAQLAAGISAAAVTRYGYPINIGNFSSGNKTELASFSGEQTITYHHLIPTRFASNSELEVAATAATKLVAKLRPSVLHAATDFVNGEIAAAVSVATDLPFAYEVRGFLEQSWLTKSPSNTIESDFYQEFLRRETNVMRRAAAITTLSETMKAEIVKRGITAEKIHLVPNAVSDQLLKEVKSASEARVQLQLPELPTFGIATTLYPFENVSLLITALEQLWQEGKQAQLLIVGDGPEIVNLSAQANSSAVAKHIHLVGRKPFEQTITHYQAMDVFCVPRTQSLVTELVTPLKPIEAMALGRPVIASNLPALAELINHEQTGLLVAPDSAAALTEAISGLLYDSGHRQRLAAAAKDWVAETRTWSQVAKTYQQVYQQLGKP